MQALSEKDLCEWIDAMDGAKQNSYTAGENPSCSTYKQSEFNLFFEILFLAIENPDMAKLPFSVLCISRDKPWRNAKIAEFLQF